jgi:hypothetical protein
VIYKIAEEQTYSASDTCLVQTPDRYSFRSCLSPNPGALLRHLERVPWFESAESMYSKCTTLEVGVYDLLFFPFVFVVTVWKTLVSSFHSPQSTVGKVQLNTAVICRAFSTYQNDNLLVPAIHYTVMR